MTVHQRLFTFCIFALGFVLFATGPAWLQLDEDGQIWWQAVTTLCGPLAASIACFAAARRGTPVERSAWRNFGIGSAIYFAGNVGYLLLALIDRAPVFPSLAEAAFFVMALFFAAGMLKFTQVQNRFGLVQIYNFALIYCAIALSAIILLNRNIGASVLPPFATIVAFLYPALWFSVAAFGVLSLLLYAYGRKSVAYGLMVLAMMAEAVSDGRYALALLDGTYQIGGITQLLWLASNGLIVWSALEQIIATRSTAGQATIRRPVRDNSITQAMIPALAAGAILVSGSMSGALGEAPYSFVAAALAISFALFAGLREHWIINTQRKLRRSVEHSREELAASQKQLTAVLESTQDCVLVADTDWRIVYWNGRAAALTGPGRLQIGMELWALFPPSVRDRIGQYRDAAANRRPVEFEVLVGESQRWLGITVYPTDDGVSIFFRDISEQKRARDEIIHLAHHDPLTGLANRNLFQQRLDEAAGADSAVLLVDLDHFKEVNDTLGHPAGDVLLVSVANRLREVLGPQVTIARVGGDEFAAILTGHDGKAEISMIALQLIEAVAAPYTVHGQALRVGASIGIALGENGVEGGGRGSELFKDADLALYAAKAETRGSYRFFEKSMQKDVLHKQVLRSDLAEAIEREEFVLAFQPLLDLHSNRVCGFEALLRWNHPRRGVVPPAEFIPVAEESGLIVTIGEWALRQAALEAMRWPADITVAVNLSSRQFADDNLATIVERVLDDTGLPAARLELEITETVLMRDSESNLRTLQRLRARGIRFALDDFGTGFSSLNYLQRFPFSKIKIDRAFISGLPGSGESQAIVRSVIGLGKSLGMRVTAEGVETEAQLDWVRAGCDEAQGYLLSKPVPGTEIPHLLARLTPTRLAS